MKKILFFMLSASIFLSFSSTFAVIKILTIERQPFVFYKGEKITGFSIELLEEITKRLGLQYTLQVEDSFSEMLEKIKNKDADIAISNISITAEREKSMDFSYPVFESGIQILERKTNSSLLNFGQIKSVLLIIFGIMIFHWVLQWLKKHTSLLGNIPSSAYLMVLRIIGGGRTVINFTNNIFPSTQENENFNVLTYIKGKSIGTSVGTTMSHFLETNNIDYTKYPDYQKALQALEGGEIDLLLADSAVAKYYAHRSGKDKVQLVGDTFEHDELGIAFRSRYNLRKKINQTLLKIKEDGTYERLMLKYFGEEY